MKFEEVFCHTFKAIRERLYWKSFELYHPKSWVNSSLSLDSQFCQAVVNSGYLTFEQLLNAAYRYRLGSSKNGGVIFWQIDHEGRIHDGKIMYYHPNCHRIKGQNPTWVSYLLAKREGLTQGQYSTSHCLFGLHQISGKGLLDKPSGKAERGVRGERIPVAIVEAEKTAVILSEHYPQYIWLAAGGMGELQVNKFRPLRGRKVVLFPDTDPDGKTFASWHQRAQEVMAEPFWEDSPPIRVSPVLELHATPEQKQRKIDLIDFLFEPSFTMFHNV